VLAAILLVGLEPPGLLLVFSEIETARHGALHGPCGDAPIVDAEEELWRERQDVLACDMEQSAVGDGLRLGENGKSCCGLVGARYGNRIGEVDLVGITGFDVALDGKDSLGVLVEGDVEIGLGGEAIERFGRGCLGRSGAEELSESVVEDQGLSVCPKPCQRK
jgi:hypothetical protein